MPIYEYHCTACGHNLEEMQKFSDAPLTVCPKCGKNSLQKKISLAGFQLKGTGWYATDFKDKKPTSAAASAEGKADKATAAESSASSTSDTTTTSSTEKDKPSNSSSSDKKTETKSD
jgi:putative FmdB family regulatory protein